MQTKILNVIQIPMLLSLIFFISGCASFGEGLARAILEKTESEDTRECQIWGKPYQGIEAGLSKNKGGTKLLMVHGVGDHIPGYTTELLEKLAKELDLNARTGNYKDITLQTPLYPDQNLGSLRITHLFNEKNGRELTFYELTWSEITRKEKELLAFDNSGEYDFRRAKINGLLKKFSNDTGPDPIIYLGKSREAILSAFSQSFCWVATRDWNELPESGQHACLGLSDKDTPRMINDDYVLISHSLGSRIIIDGMQRIAKMLGDPGKNEKVELSQTAINALRNKTIPMFMLSNQLPMLQLGRDLPEVAGQKNDYCKPEGKHYNERMLNETEIFAFSDPNDLLSYGIPPGFSEKYLDSRLCTSITNININIAKVIDAFGISDLANPLQAHVGYDQDDRVVALIAKGFGQPGASDLVKERCEFTEIKK